MIPGPDTRESTPRPRSSDRIDRAAASPATAIRPELQALRAFAVTLVVVFHAFPESIRGGYVGVDVFFVLSGFLIIGHLLRELQATGNVRVLAFWARRARRLIPASLLALAVTVVATIIWVPQLNWVRYFHEAGAAAVYVLNAVLAGDSVDYLAAENGASPVQHFWSLSIEEQLYIAWPLVILLVIAIARRADAALRVRVVIVVLVVLTVASAAYSVWETDRSQASAYFLTGTRAWEFGVGGILAAMTPLLTRIPARLGAAMSWAGLLLIAASAVFYSDATAFPGFAAWVPVSGTLLVIAAGLPTSRWAPSSLFRLRPIQWLGDVSYSLYLWHWPFLVIAPFALQRGLEWTDRVVIVLAAIVLAGVSKLTVEDPIRRSAAILRRGPAMTVIATVVATSLFFAATSVGAAVQQQRIDEERADLAAAAAALEEAPPAQDPEDPLVSEPPGSCFGASAFGPGRSCPTPFAVTAYTDPTIAVTDIGKGVRIQDDCKQTLEDPTVLRCELGETVDPTLRVALVGDSHAGHLLEAVDRYASRHGWAVTTYLKTWCQGLGSPGVASADAGTPAGIDSCAEWGDRVLTTLAGDPELDAVIFSNFTASYARHDPSAPGRAVTVADFTTAWDRLQVAGKQVIVVRDLPNTGGGPAPQCVAASLGEYDPCRTPRASAFPATDPQWDAVGADPDVIGIDLTDRFCDANFCHTVIGGLIVYFDSHHLTATFARTMAPVLGDAVAKALANRETSSSGERAAQGSPATQP